MTPLEIGLCSSIPAFLAGMLMNNSMNRWSFEEQKKAVKRAAKAIGEQEYEPYPQPDMKHPLTVYIGADEKDAQVHANIGKLPHWVIAGLSNGGKSNFINSIILQLLKRPATQVQLCLLDMKEGIEFSWYEGVRHLAHEIAHTAEGSVNMLDWIEQERQRRQYIIKAAKCKNLDGYNAANPKSKMPYIVFIIDEIADLLAEAPDSIAKLQKLGRLARSAGIHMIIATQYPKADTVPTALTVNCGGRMAFRLNNAVQSRVILDNPGAEELRGQGIGLFSHMGITRRIKTPFVPDSEVEKAVEQAQKIKLRRAA